MYLINFFMLRKKTPANIAKKRLKILISKQKKKDNLPHYLPELKRDLITVICKYIEINSKKISIKFEEKNNNISVLELNIILNKKKLQK